MRTRITWVIGGVVAALLVLAGVDIDAPARGKVVGVRVLPVDR